ncbi:protein MON2 homolog isoform X2 [Solanum tuberosum]|uniref:protein MON2 homolog isoform X2 n=1 Tax=Solanum tuberosum TaxID=4113 RepID=UPI0003D281EC|nr:PREDICTED: protein MON2 homolog isoform X2 [Solanum tuberosum]
MALMAVLESDLRALSAEARRRYPAVKDAAEHAILKLRSLSSPSEIAHNEDILKIFLMACEVRTVKMSVIGLSCLQKLISHDVVATSALKEILDTLKDHGEMADESLQLKTLQTILIIFQSRLQPDNEEYTAQALGIILRLLEHNRSSDSVRNTAAATFRQAVALIFDRVISAESLPAGKFGSGVYISRSSSVTSDVNRNINHLESLEQEVCSGGPSLMRDILTNSGKLALRLLEDLTALAAGGSAVWLRASSIQRTFALDILEFILSNYVVLFRVLVPYEEVLRRQICSLLMTSLRTDTELEGESGEPYFRRLVLRSVANIIRHYSSSLITESEVFLSMLVRVISLDLPLWHRILVLEILRGFCVEARTMRILFLNFDMHPKNTNVVESMVKALARVVSSIQFQDTCEESLAAVAGMFSSKAKGIEWSLDSDASNAAVLVASEAHAITLAIEGLLGVVFTVATLTDEAVDMGELDSPRCESDPPAKLTGRTALLCVSMVDSMWLTILDALSFILAKSQGEAIILEILKGYQAFTQACGILHAVEPLNSFLASLCKFTIGIPVEVEKRSVVQSPGSKRSEALLEPRETVVLTPKNVQALRTLFNISHRLHNVLGPSWSLVLETLASLDRAIHSPHATTQEVSTAVPKLTRDSSGQYSDFHILSSLNSQLFESSALMHLSAVKSLLSALRQLSHQCMSAAVSGFGPTSSQKSGSISFSVERMLSILVNNVHRVEPLWDEVIGHFIELTDSSNQHVRIIALNAMDQSISAVLGSNEFQEHASSKLKCAFNDVQTENTELRSLECSVISPLKVLFSSAENIDVRAASLKILLHVLERHGEKLHYSWPNILELLRSVADAAEKDLVTLGFQNLRVIMNDGLSTVPADCLHVCIDVTGAYSAQNTELNISLTAIGLLWTSTDFVVKGFLCRQNEEKESDSNGMKEERALSFSGEVNDQALEMNIVDRDKLLFSVFSLLQNLGADERPEVRNSAVRTLFQILGSHGQKLSKSMWEDCLWNYIFPTLDRSSHMAATSSKTEWQGKELGTRGGKAVHMLIHHSRNTAQKQWDETLVLVLGGIARILRSFFPFLRSLDNFQSGWETLLLFVRNSIFNGSKEVALAAVNCLQSTIVSHSPKGNLPMPYLTSVLDVYELVLHKSPNYNGNMAYKLKQEILHGLGELYVQAQGMFDNDTYLKLLSVVDSGIKQAKVDNSNFEAEYGHVSPVQRTALEILPQLRPAEHLSAMWSPLLTKLLLYLPSSASCMRSIEDESDHKTRTKDNAKISNGIASASQGEEEASPRNPDSTTVIVSNHLFVEKLVPVLVDLFLQAPPAEKYKILPDIIQSLGRCMITRRDNPDGSLWRLAVEGFSCILLDDIRKLTGNAGPELTITRPARMRIWKEVADIFEIFLIGYCGRALSVMVDSADESLEMNLLDILGDKILKSQIDAPLEILERLISTLDRCASRTCSLPLETVELMPSHCSRFSLTCLQKLFLLCSQGTGEWNSTRCEVSNISIKILISRCEFILERYLMDESKLGENPLPAARVEEVIFTLEELGLLVVHSDTVSQLPLHPSLKECLTKENQARRSHLLVLFPSLCELVISREARVRELVQQLLRYVTIELGLPKSSLTVGS